jgi:hypothetical protein
LETTFLHLTIKGKRRIKERNCRCTPSRRRIGQREFVRSWLEANGFRHVLQLLSKVLPQSEKETEVRKFASRTSEDLGEEHGFSIDASGHPILPFFISLRNGDKVIVERIGTPVNGEGFRAFYFVVTNGSREFKEHISIGISKSSEISECQLSRT